MSLAVPTRDPSETAAALERWLPDRLGVGSLRVGDLTVPKAGFSNETIVGTAAWDGGSLEFVLRVQPTGHQLFVEPDALRQARVMTVLTGDVPVPPILATEPDPAVLGAPFFLMPRVPGRIPGDVPSWHRRGWTTELTPEQRARLHDAALGALVRLHHVDTAAPELAFLERPGAGTPLERHVAHLAHWHEWCRPVLRYDADVIAEAMRYVQAEQPADDRRAVVWGDARVGNMIFADDLSVAALLDWEEATLGPPEIDVAWWAMFDEFLCEAQGYERLAGVPDRQATFASYEELSGVALRDIEYYGVLAGLQLCLINSRLADLLVATGKAPEPVAAEFVTRVAAMTAAALRRATGA